MEKERWKRRGSGCISIKQSVTCLVPRTRRRIDEETERPAGDAV